MILYKNLRNFVESPKEKDRLLGKLKKERRSLSHEER